MAYNLIKIAKELNVATSTIVEYLASKGITIESKPTAKISDEEHIILLEKFSSTMAEKERAEALLEERKKRKEAYEEEKIEEKKSTPLKEVHKPTLQEKKPVEEEKNPVKEEEKHGLTVLRKIDLDALNKKKTKPIEVEKVVENEPAKQKENNDNIAEIKTDNVSTPTTTPTTIEVKEVESQEKSNSEDKENNSDNKIEQNTPVNESNEEEIIRMETPKLKGLKKLGKIDVSKFQPKKKTEKPVKQEEKPKEQTPPQKDANNDIANRKKRKRKRRKITPDQVSQNNANNKKPKTDEVKEISEKEIEEKIKSTIAKLQGTGKSKRQKIRKESKIIKREKTEVSEELEEKILEVSEFISVSELASIMNEPVTNIITTCMNLGVIVSINQRIEKEIIELVAEEYGYEVKYLEADEMNDEDEEIFIENEEDLESRAPIVTVMGHVDHGKTSLLDYIRQTNVVSGEAGGITQHVGAYEVILGDNKTITFIDTPGHEAFTAMRARGAKVTDIVIIVIAADDRIMPQTKEAISHSQAAGVPMIFAINKIDKAGADPEKIKQELAAMNLLVEDWGGKYQSQDISAKSGIGIEELLEKVFLEAEMLDLKANPKRPSIGTVLEATLDKGKGFVSNILVQNGTLKIGSTIVAGHYFGKIKAMFNDRGKRIKTAGPSKPVKILGMNGAAQAGEVFKEYLTEKTAKNIASKRSIIAREQLSRTKKRISLEEIGRRLQLDDFKELNLIVKADMDGTAEALSDSLIKLSINEINVNVIHKGVGQISESDVLLASASNAIIIGFQVRPSGNARKVAEKEGVEIKTYSIIYEAIDEVKLAMEGMLEPTKEERIKGLIEVRETFKISKVGTIAGSYVLEGTIDKNSYVRVVRDGIVIYPNRENQNISLSSLKRFKNDVKEVKAGMECGLTVENFNDIKVGDQIEAYEIINIEKHLD
ncbi:MAG: translation initiation factor IF-2 [Saprospiraceae bacterium]